MSPPFRPGHELRPLRHQPTGLQVFRFSAVTWNPHRIHFDERYAHSEGHPGVLVQSHLRGALAVRCLTEGLGPEATVTQVRYRVRRPATPGHTLTYVARVTEITDLTATFELSEKFDDAEIGLEGTAVVTFPRSTS